MAHFGFWSLAQLAPDRVAVIDEAGREVTARELLASCNQLARALTEQGLGPGSVVASACGNRLQVLQLCLAGLQVGWYLAVLDPKLPQPDIEALLNEQGAEFLLSDQPQRAWSPALGERLGGRLLLLENPGRSWRTLCQGHSSETPANRQAGQLLFFTSGTTGQARAIKRSLSGLSPEVLGRQAARHLHTVCGLTPQSGAVHLVASPLHHSASLLWCLDQLHLGHTVVLGLHGPEESEPKDSNANSRSPGWDPRSALELMSKHRVTATLMVPTHFVRLLGLSQEVRQSFDPSNLRHVVHTGATCSIPVKRSMLDWWGPVLYEVYGAAESPGTRVGPEEWLQHPGTVGRSHGRVQILRGDGALCRPGEVGRVLLRSGRREGFVEVGDLGYLEQDDYLFLVGRADDTIITGGVNVHPIPVEAVLGSHPGVLEVAVYGEPDPEWGQRVVAAVVPRPGQNLCLKELEGFARAHLSGPKRPRSYHLVNDLPRTDQGKLNRGDLATHFASDPPSGGAPVAPR